MVQFIAGNDLDFRAAVYGAPSQGSLNLVRQTTEQLSQLFGGMKSAFLEKVQQISEDLSGSHTVNLMKAALNKLTYAFLPDVIQYYSNIDMIQQAAEKMRYLIMSEPTLLQKFRDQQIAGYDGHFEDLYPEQIGNTHPVYQQVNHGIVYEDEDEDCDRVDMFFIEEDGLTIQEQADVKHTQSLTLSYVLYGRFDPTSTYNQKF